MGRVARYGTPAVRPDDVLAGHRRVADLAPRRRHVANRSWHSGRPARPSGTVGDPWRPTATLPNPGERARFDLRSPSTARPGGRRRPKASPPVPSRAPAADRSPDAASSAPSWARRPAAGPTGVHPDGRRQRHRKHCYEQQPHQYHHIDPAPPQRQPGGRPARRDRDAHRARRRCGGPAPTEEVGEPAPALRARRTRAKKAGPVAAQGDGTGTSAGAGTDQNKSAELRERAERDTAADSATSRLRPTNPRGGLARSSPPPARVHDRVGHRRPAPAPISRPRPRQRPAMLP